MKSLLLSGFLVLTGMSLPAQDTLPIFSKAPIFEATDASGQKIFVDN